MTAIAENDSCCIGILQFHEIKREKKGRFVRFLKVEFDHIMGAVSAKCDRL